MAMKHPHGCGEDADRPAAISAGSETPPRVWGRLPAVCDGPAAPGNTPTGVGKTAYLGSATDFNMKHPHGCGEDQSHESRTGCDLETPPRVWGRPDVFRPRLGLHRNTPTGVGKTSFWMQHVFKVEKHPHGCGEDDAGIETQGAILETPPRVWGRPEPARPTRPRRGNTPTGVGKTAAAATPKNDKMKHPHGCGEDPACR